MPLVLALGDGAHATGFLHRWAGIEVWSDVRLEPEAATSPRPEAPPLEDAAQWQLVAAPDSADPLAPRRVLRAETGDERWRVDFADEQYLIAGDGTGIRRVANARAAGAPRLERLLGAPCALALAARGIHLLHASGLAREGVAVALTAESGGGKSTLAEAAHRRAPAWRRLADDLLPVRLGPRPIALPRYPQLKLSSDDADPRAAPEALPLGALIELDRAAEGAGFALERFEPAAAALALARATAAARCFDRRLLAAHLEACAAAARALTVARLRYPTGLDRLGEVLDRLAALG